MTKREQVAADYLGGMSLADIVVKYGYSSKHSAAVMLGRWGIKLSKEELSRRASLREEKKRNIALCKV